MSEYCDKFLTEARRHIGKETDIRWGRYPVEYEPIRRWCHMVNSLNPLYLDKEYAKQTKWGNVICPSLMIPIFAHSGWGPSASGPEIDWPPPKKKEQAQDITPSTPGNKVIVLGGGLEFFKPVQVGDLLGAKTRIADIYIKAIRLDPEAFWLATEIMYLNQKSEVVAKSSNLRILHRDKEQIASTTPEQLSMIQ